jgi:Sulfotransferase family
MVGAHPEIAITRETHWISEVVGRGRGIDVAGRASPRLPEVLEAQLPTCADAPVTTAALRSRWHVLQCRASGARLSPEQYLELRYEALVADPEGECRRLCDFLDVAFDPAMLRFHQGRKRFETDWTTRMPLAQVEEFEAAAGDALEAFGYRRGARRVTART